MRAAPARDSSLDSNRPLVRLIEALAKKERLSLLRIEKGATVIQLGRSTPASN